jgi:hypothetical protein
VDSHCTFRRHNFIAEDLWVGICACAVFSDDVTSEDGLTRYWSSVPRGQNFSSEVQLHRWSFFVQCESTFMVDSHDNFLANFRLTFCCAHAQKTALTFFAPALPSIVFSKVLSKKFINFLNPPDLAFDFLLAHAQKRNLCKWLLRARFLKQEGRPGPLLANNLSFHRNAHNFRTG